MSTTITYLGMWVLAIASATFGYWVHDDVEAWRHGMPPCITDTECMKLCDPADFECDGGPQTKED